MNLAFLPYAIDQAAPIRRVNGGWDWLTLWAVALLAPFLLSGAAP